MSVEVRSEDYPSEQTIKQSLTMMADHAMIRAVKAQETLEFMVYEKWKNIHIALEKCVTEVEQAGNFKQG